MSAFCTPADIAAVLGREIDPSDATALAACELATVLIQGATGQALSQVSEDTVEIDGTQTAVVLLPEIPVTAVASVSVDGDELDTDAYSWGARGQLRRIDGAAWPEGLRNIEVTYTHGYAVLPKAVTSIATQLAARIYETPTIPKSETIGGYSVNYGVTFNETNIRLYAHELVALEKYRSR